MRSLEIVREERERTLEFIKRNRLRYDERREKALNTLQRKEHEALQKYAESHVKHEEEYKKVKQEMEEQAKEKAREERKALRKAKRNIELLRIQQLQRAKSWEKRLKKEDEQLEKFYEHQKELKQQRILENQFRLLKTKLNFDRIMTEYVNSTFEI
jgi:hypothetical protein